MTDTQLTEALERLTAIVGMHVEALEQINIVLELHQERMDNHHKRMNRMEQANGA